MPYLVKTPNALKPLANDLLWSLDQFRDRIFLTFDDGPTPEITYQILDILDKLKYVEEYKDFEFENITKKDMKIENLKVRVDKITS